MLFGKPVEDVVPAHKRAFDKDWQKMVNEYDQKIAKERQRIDRERP